MSVLDLKAKQEQISKNGKIILLVIVLAGSLLLIRLWYLQIIKGGILQPAVTEQSCQDPPHPGFTGHHLRPSSPYPG